MGIKSPPPPEVDTLVITGETIERMSQDYDNMGTRFSTLIILQVTLQTEASVWLQAVTVVESEPGPDVMRSVFITDAFTSFLGEIYLMAWNILELKITCTQLLFPISIILNTIY